MYVCTYLHMHVDYLPTYIDTYVRSDVATTHAIVLSLLTYLPNRASLKLHEVL
jgi:hypothetical protein